MALLMMVATLLASPVQGPESAAPAWLEGCWVSRGGGTEERWLSAGGGLLFGHNVVRRRGEVVFFEQLRIEATQNGSVFFAYPRGVGPTRFKESARTGASITFDNPEHDDPQRIIYEREGDDLTATVSLIDGSRQRQWMYSACPTEGSS
ncbi:MAG: DUF6265 family protein [Pseudomonadota bacterium]